MSLNKTQSKPDIEVHVGVELVIYTILSVKNAQKSLRCRASVGSGCLWVTFGRGPHARGVGPLDPLAYDPVLAA